MNVFRETERGRREAVSPDIAVPAVFDQFFVCGWWESAGLEGKGGGGGGRTFEFVFAYVDGGWRVDHVGGEVVDHCLFSLERYLGKEFGGSWRYERSIISWEGNGGG